MRVRRSERIALRGVSHYFLCKTSGLGKTLPQAQDETYGFCSKTCRRTQACMAIAAAAPAFIDLVEPNCAIERIASQISAASGVIPMLSCPKSRDRKSTRLNSSHVAISYAVFCLKKKKAPCVPRSSLDRQSLRL